MPKLYTHPKLIDLEFLNAYRTLAQGRVGADGAAGPRGSQGPDGQSAIQTIVLTDASQIGIATGPAILMDFWGVLYTWTAGSNPVTFDLLEDSVGIAPVSFDVATTPVRFWPKQTYYGNQFGKLLEVNTEYQFETNASGIIVVVINFLPLADFP